MNTTRRTCRCASRRKVVGHAVRAMYLYSGMADIATEYNDDSLTAALETLWDDLTTKQMYITGGIGPAAANEGFTDYYDLPNESAYAETCASVGLVFWASRMLGRGPDRRYADIMEQALYNGAHARPLARRRDLLLRQPAGKRRQAPSLDLALTARAARPTSPASSPRSAPTCTPSPTTRSRVHLYGESTARFNVGGADVELDQTTRYPWDGAIALRPAARSSPARFAALAAHPRHGRTVPRSASTARWSTSRPRVRDGYARIERDWQRRRHGRPRPCRSRRAAIWPTRRSGRTPAAWRCCAARSSIAPRRPTMATA